MRGSTKRWVAAAALVVAAALIRTAWTELGASPPAADPVLEARVLDRTIDALERRYAADPGNPVVGATLVDRRMAMFRLDNDLEHLKRAETIAADLAPLALDASGAHSRLSAVRLARHDFRGALEGAERAIEANPRDAGALGVLFDAAMAAGRYDRARWAVETLEHEHQGSLAQRFRTARWLDWTGDAPAARQVLHRLCERLDGRAVDRQTVAWCHALLADMDVGLEGPEAAERRYRHVLDIQPEYMAGIEGLADLAYVREEWIRARELYRRILSDTHPDLYLRLAEIESALGNPVVAVEHERRFLDLATGEDAEALNAHPLAIYLSLDPSTHDRALDVALADLSARPSVESYEVVAWVRLQRGEIDEALAASAAARAQGVPGPTSDYIHGRILERAGATEEGRALVREAIAAPFELDHHVLTDLRARRTALD